MSATKPTKPTVKQLQKVIDEQNKVIEALMDELAREKKSIRLPEVMTVRQFNVMVDFLKSCTPEPEYPKEVPGKKEIPEEKGSSEPVIIQMGEGGEA